MLAFIHSLFEQGLSYSTINAARSALSNHLMDATFNSTNYTMTTHPFIVRFMKGIFNSRKPGPRYSETWDVNVVLNYLREMHLLLDLSLKEHSWKLVMLLALTSGQRCQTFTCLDITAMKKTDDYYVFHLPDHVIQNRPGNVVSTFYVRRYQQEELCVYKH